MLLSIGYAACHWCHVMAHESFEDEATAALMNRLFVNVKVDREERPDVDAIYMQAVQAMTGHGGWPMTMFLTPEGEPFYGGTYFPPDDRHGLPSFRRILESVAGAWASRRVDVERTAASLREMYQRSAAPLRSGSGLDEGVLHRAEQSMIAAWDPINGGFGEGPKFPPTMALEFLLGRWERTRDLARLDMALDGWNAMARGGLHDHVGGGFHRYCVDSKWTVPHFEKMLYDNALLIRLGTHLWQATGDEGAREVAERALDWLAREMTSPDGGFYSSLDADTDGEEGTFYTWTPAQLRDALGAEAGVAAAWFGVTDAGNFEGSTVLHLPHSEGDLAASLAISPAELRERIDGARRGMLEARDRRNRPPRDDKVIAGWNGLTLRAVALAARAFRREQDRDLAMRSAGFLRGMVRNGRVGRVWSGAGGKPLPGVLEDHAAVALAFLDVHALTLDPAWIHEAAAIGDACVEFFWDEDAGSFYDTASDAAALITRPREVTDNALPSGTSLACELFLSLDALLNRPDLAGRAIRVLNSLAEPMAEHATAFGHLLCTADTWVSGGVEVALAGDPASEIHATLQAVIGCTYLPGAVVAGSPGADDSIALLAGRTSRNGLPAAYVCSNRSCQLPTSDVATLLTQFDEAYRPGWRSAGHPDHNQPADT